MDRNGTRVLMVAAAESAFLAQGRLQGDLDVPLTERGRSEAARLRERLGAVAAICSAPNQSARETAAVLAEGSGCRVRVLPELRGVSFGLWEGQLVSEVVNRHSRPYEEWRRNPLGFTPPNGEKMERAFARAGQAARKILRRHPGGAVAVVAPETVLGLLYCGLAGIPPERVFDVTREMGALRIWPDEGVG